MSTNVSQILRQASLRWPGATALVDLGTPGSRARRWTYAELDAAARRVASAFEPGQRVVLMADNSALFCAAWFGIVYAGATVVPVPSRAAAPEVALRVTHAGCDALISGASCREVASQALAGVEPPPVHHDLVQLTTTERAPLDGPRSALADDAAMILYTSGTTAAAKGAVITHASLLLHTQVVTTRTLALGRDDVVLGVLPMTHSYGCRMVMLASFCAGASAVLTPRFSASRSLDAIADYAVTWIPAVPTMFAALGRRGPGRQSAALRWCLSAGAPLADDIRLRAQRRLGAEIRQGYGMTEATFSTIDAPPHPMTPGSVGRPVWGVEVRALDDSGADVAVDTPGELWIRGHNAMLEYLDAQEATDAIRVDGWLRSGDIGRISAQGVVTVVDRKKDVILRGGFTVYPSEVEEALTQHPAIGQAAVVGRPDDFLGERIVGVVVIEGLEAWSVESVRAFCAERIADYKVPDAIVAVAELPLGPSRKVLKRELRRRLLDGTLG